MAGREIPWMLSRSTFLWRLAPPFPRPLPPLPWPNIGESMRVVVAAGFVRGFILRLIVLNVTHCLLYKLFEFFEQQ